MEIFDTKVQFIKYKVLREVAREEWNGTLGESLIDLPKKLIPGKTPTMRCCVYKERAIIGERIKIAMGGDKENHNIIEVIDIACEECPMGGYEITNSCRGCLAHRCENVCRFGAITFDAYHIAHIDKTKCRECGACASVCPFNAIRNHKRPCEMACKVGAISMGESRQACINNDKCISCGTCVYLCPFGAISDKSSIVDVVDMLKNSNNNTDYRVFAVIAPTMATQFTRAGLGRAITGLKRLGFHKVVEAALGADIVAQSESRELAEKGFLASSCCPAFVDYIGKSFPKLLPFVSHNLSPMATVSRVIKEHDPLSKVVFIGPCTAKKAEVQKEDVRPYVDAVITFEELQALYDSRDIDISTLEETELDNASYFGRIFARCGGLADAISHGLSEQGIDFDFKPISCDGIEQCRTALMLKSKERLDADFIEGMACVGGCIGGAGCLSHSEKGKALIDSYGKQALKPSISEAVSSSEKELFEN